MRSGQMRVCRLRWIFQRILNCFRYLVLAKGRFLRDRITGTSPNRILGCSLFVCRFVCYFDCHFVCHFTARFRSRRSI